MRTPDAAHGRPRPRPFAEAVRGRPQIPRQRPQQLMLKPDGAPQILRAPFPGGSVTSPSSRAPALPSIAASLSVHPRSSGGLVPFRAPHSDPPFLLQPGRPAADPGHGLALGLAPRPGLRPLYNRGAGYSRGTPRGPPRSKRMARRFRGESWPRRAPRAASGGRPFCPRKALPGAASWRACSPRLGAFPSRCPPP